MFCFLKPWQRQYHCVNTCKICLKYNVCFRSHRPCGPCLWFFKVTLFNLLVFPNSLTLISMIKVMRIFKVQTLITHLSKLKTWTLFGNEQSRMCVMDIIMTSCYAIKSTLNFGKFGPPCLYNFLQIILPVFEIQSLLNYHRKKIMYKKLSHFT